jgi:LmbE family N-acetylglucosaminyl deacetylase
MPAPVAIAVGAHPDDIEFHMAGTLLLLKQAGYETHYLNLASGHCGSSETSAQRTRSIRAREARTAAKILSATFHGSLTDDLEILYTPQLLRRLAALMREVKPKVVLTHSPSDYMEDHMNTSRLTVTAAFARGMTNFRTTPPHRHTEQDVTVYHAMPHGLRDGLRRRILPGAFVQTTSVQATKQEALAAHRSQQNWLETSQGFNSYLAAMDKMSREVGRLSGRFQHAEGWRRHLHLGLSTEDSDPLGAALGDDYLVNLEYEQNLEKGI